MTFGQRFKQLRQEHKLTQEKLAEKFFLNKSSISRYEQDKQVPELDLLEKLADFFDVSVDYLLCRTDVRTSQKISKINSEYLSEKDEKDIAKTMQKLKSQLQNEEGLMFNGEPVDEETADLLLQALELQERMIKTKNKKYTPKKYRE